MYDQRLAFNMFVKPFARYAHCSLCRRGTIERRSVCLQEKLNGESLCFLAGAEFWKRKRENRIREWKEKKRKGVARPL